VTGVEAAPRAARRLERDPDDAIFAGVCAAVARRLGIDPILVRVGFAIVCVATTGFAVIAYFIAWPFIPEKGEKSQGPAPAAAARPTERRIVSANWRVAGGVGLLTLSFLLILRELGIWWSDALIWPLILASSGAALLWRQSRAMAPEPEPVAAHPGALIPPKPRGQRAGIADLYRGGFGIALVIGAVLLFLASNDVLGDAKDVVLTVIAATAGLALILAPFLWRLGRNLASERAERIRSQERAELAAHLHDSVLQTLTLVQKRAGDPREVAQLARHQERELRDWLFDSDRAPASESLARALELAAEEVEDAHRVPINVVAVGDMQMDERAEALTAATREAMVNAAKFAPDAGEIAVYAELGPERAQVFVRDRGPGFDPTDVPEDRRGLRESIIGRMERFGGRAEVRSGAGRGTEVALTMEQQS
jgi:phage shock protein PspC (stress-responsive transcriptional regulator)/signal transduction histidine kinase